MGFEQMVLGVLNAISPRSWGRCQRKLDFQKEEGLALWVEMARLGNFNIDDTILVFPVLLA